jgi:hypothetical protein
MPARRRDAALGTGYNPDDIMPAIRRPQQADETSEVSPVNSTPPLALALASVISSPLSMWYDHRTRPSPLVSTH